MKTAVITGSTRGLGFEMAKLFHKNGWNLVLNGTKPDKLEAAVRTLRASEGSGGVEGCRGSVTSSADLQTLVDTAVKHFGAIDIWINNPASTSPCARSGS